MADPVLLLVRSGILMLFDHARIIIVDGGAGNNACLRAPVHGLGIYIVAGSCVLDKTSLTDPVREQITGMLVDALVINIHLGRH